MNKLIERKYVDLKKEEKKLQKIRGERIKEIRQELGYNKTKFAQEILVTSQFLGLIEKGEGNLPYRSLKLLRELSGYSSDYILFGIDDNVINETKRLLKTYSNEELIERCEILKRLAISIKNDKNTI